MATLDFTTKPLALDEFFENASLSNPNKNISS